MHEDHKNPHAVALGRNGGAKIAERGSEYFADLQSRRKQRNGGRPKNPPKATYTGTLSIGDLDISCAVLDDGTRLITQYDYFKAIGRSGRPAAGRGSSVEKVAPFLALNNLKPFVDSELHYSTKPVVFCIPSGSRAFGYRAETLPMVCEVYLRARDAGALLKTQQKFAKACDLIMRGLAHVGIIALVDEATGYQASRDREALQAILDKFLSDQLAAWAKRFPDEFYRQMFRLRDWEWKGMKVNRPQVVGHYTNDLVYERLAKGILDELESRNPKNAKGGRKAKHHQWLSVDIGNPALQQHLGALLGLMRISDNWAEFYALVERALPKKGDTLFLPFDGSGGQVCGSG